MVFSRARILFLLLGTGLLAAVQAKNVEGSALLSELDNIINVQLTNTKTCDDATTHDCNFCTTHLSSSESVNVKWWLDDAALAEEYDFSEVTVALCFSDFSITDRKWRKHKDIIDKDKQCKAYRGGLNKPGFVSTGTPWKPTDGIMEDSILLRKDQGTGTYFVRILVKNSAGDYIAYGDNTNTTKPFCGETIMDPVTGEPEFVNGIGCGYFKLTPLDSITDSMKIISSGFVIFSLVALVAILVFEFKRDKPNVEHFIGSIGDDSAHGGVLNAAGVINKPVRNESAEDLISYAARTERGDSAESHAIKSSLGPGGKTEGKVAKSGKSTLDAQIQSRKRKLNEQFKIKVDAEGKAMELKVLTASFPHMISFHLSTISFFVSFLSTFAAAPMMPVIRDNLDLTIRDIGNGNIASVSACVGARLVMGWICDTFGPRYGHTILQLMTAPAVALMPLVTTPGQFICCRFFIGMGLATFVCSQFWASVLFSGIIVGTANATSGGWGNLGGGVTQFFMPVVLEGIVGSGVDQGSAWRYAYYVPACFHIMIALATVRFGQDLPYGNYTDLKSMGLMVKKSAQSVIALGAMNYRSWCLFILYAFSFGVELTMNNIAASYFFDRFSLGLGTASLIASLFGMMNLFARTLGGLCSDWASTKFGMRGRLWAMSLIMLSEGAACIGMGLCNNLTGAVVLMIIFSAFVQAAEGATYGVVPFVSRRALGIVSGIVGAGGNLGSVTTLALFFKGQYDTQDGILYMGMMIVGVTMVFSGILNFPQWGGMFTAPKEGVTEEDYYSMDYTEAEIANGEHLEVMSFAENSRRELGPKGNAKRFLGPDGKSLSPVPKTSV